MSAQAGVLLAGRWRDLGGTVTEARAAVLDAGLRAPVEGARHATWQLRNGSREHRELTDRFVDDVRGANDRLWLANPYLGDPGPMQEVVEAARRGLDVRLILVPKATSSQVQDVFTDPLRRAWAYEIREAGGTVVLAPEFSHTKAWIADARATVGAFNLDGASTKRNWENAISTEDPVALAAVEAMFARQQTRGAVVDASVADEWRTLSRMRERLGLRY